MKLISPTGVRVSVRDEFAEELLRTGGYRKAPVAPSDPPVEEAGQRPARAPRKRKTADKEA